MRRQGIRLLSVAVLASVGFLMLVLFLWSGSYEIHPRGIVLHHSALEPPGSDALANAATIDRIHRERGFFAFYRGRIYHIGYHYVVLPDGTVEQGRPETCQGAHAKGFNDYIGVCVIGNFSSKNASLAAVGSTPTPAQVAALTALCGRLMVRYRFPPARIRAHRQVNPATECPGDRFPLDRLTAHISNTSPSSRAVGRHPP